MSKRKRREWIEKIKEDKNLVWIDPPKEGEAIYVAEKIWSMYHDDYNLTIREIESILMCGRQWVVDNVQLNVKHIFLGRPMRQFMMALKTPYDDEFVLLKDFYYFSRKDFYRWLREHTVADRKTIRVDLFQYSTNPDELTRMIREYNNRIDECVSILERANVMALYKMKIHNNLNKIGGQLYSQRGIATDRIKDSEAVRIPLELPEGFTTLKELKNIYRSNEMVYRDLYNYGAIKYTIADSLVRYDKFYRQNAYVNSKLPVPIIYSSYLSIVKR